MIAYRVPDSYDVLAIPKSWDCFTFGGWLYRKHEGGNGLVMFFREKWIGDVE